jgi:hypothetical protein
MRHLHCLPHIIAAMAVLLTQACGTMENGRRWGEDVTLMPGWSKAGQSACKAFLSPMVLAPAAAALLLQIDHADERVSQWAVEHTPTTGSTDQAEQLSSTLRGISLGSFYLSVMATPGGDDPALWLLSKAKGMAVQGSAAALSNELTFLIKDAADRRRPDGNDTESFPSGHASNAAVFTALASRNVHAMNIPPVGKTGLDIALHTVMFGVAWERVEAGVHYPSDVLAGMAMAYFIGTFINDTFMGLGLVKETTPVMGFTPDGYVLGISMRF